MLRMKSQKTPDIELPLTPITARHAELYQILAGRRSGDEFYNASGMMLGPQSALLRVGDERKFTVALEVGSGLYAVGLIHCANPLILQQSEMLTVFGPSPAEQQRAELQRQRAQMTPEERDRDIEGMYRSWGLNVSRPKGEPASYEQRSQPNARRSSSLV